ncbi:MAG: HEAT repeat domain-containing protein [Bacteroidales bacterium]|jgi:hypothetical protein|nr:HEAT repeat domain-containing protein [Bacteroidales bacterium]
MRLQPLYDLQQDINRLFIAGSKFAKGDPRLQKHIPILAKLGEKAPVFKKLSGDIEDLIQADSRQSAEKLMSVATLLYSVLYTQGDSVEVDVEVKEQVPGIDIGNVNTVFSYLQLKPVIEALTTASSGRLEILKDALERNIFEDSRTFLYLDFALADKYSELSEYVADTIIPKVGMPMLPFLLQNFTYEDKAENVRRLRLLNRFGCTEIKAMTEKILSEPLPLLQAEVIHILSGNPENETLIISLANDKNKLVREAAYMALAKLNTETSLEKLTSIYLKNKNKTNLPAIIAALATSKLPFFFREVYDMVSVAFEEFIALDKSTDDKILMEKLDRFKTLLDVFENKENDHVLNFFADVLKNKKYRQLIAAKKALLENHAYSVAHSIIGSLNTFNKATAVAFYEKNIGDIPDENWKTPLWNNYFYSAVESGYPKDKVYKTFRDVFKKGMIGVSNLYDVYSNGSNFYYYNDKDVEIYTDRIDPRWTDFLYDMFSGKMKWDYAYDQALQLINAIEPKSKKFDKLLIHLAAKVAPAEEVTIFKLIMEREIADRFSIIYSVMEKYPKNTYYYALNRLKNTGLWTRFPKEYAPKFRDLFLKTKIDLFESIADEIEFGSLK